jgi:hypothetical protein
MSCQAIFPHILRIAYQIGASPHTTPALSSTGSKLKAPPSLVIPPYTR